MFSGWAGHFSICVNDLRQISHYVCHKPADIIHWPGYRDKSLGYKYYEVSLLLKQDSKTKWDCYLRLHSCTSDDGQRITTLPDKGNVILKITRMDFEVEIQTHLFDLHFI